MASEKKGKESRAEVEDVFRYEYVLGGGIVQKRNWQDHQLNVLPPTSPN